MTEAPPIRVVLAKVGLDGHDRGIKIVARALRDAGMQVIYAGLWQTPEAVVRTVADEDADWLGLSLLSGAHMTLVPRVLQLLREAGLEHVGVLVGGIIPESDIPKLLRHGRGARLRSRHAAAGHRLFLAGAQRSRPCLRHCWNASAAAIVWPWRDWSAWWRAVNRSRKSLPASANRRKPARVVAVTGSGGVGKSTLVGKLIEQIRQTGTERCRACLRSAKSAKRRRPARRSLSHAGAARR